MQYLPKATHLLLVPGIVAGVVDDDLSADWAAVVFQIAREVGARVLGKPAPPTVGRNHYRIRLRLVDGRHVRLLLNAAARVVAAADDADPDRLDAPFHEVRAAICSSSSVCAC